MKLIQPTIQIFQINLNARMVNIGRQHEVDFARGLAVLFMIWVHVLEIYAEYPVQDSFFGYLIEFLGGPPAAPVFMLLMGVSIAYSRKSQPHKTILRGVSILLLGYLLNFLREFVPLYLGVRNGLISRANLVPFDFVTILIQVDILQFAGLALIFLGLLGALKIKTWAYLLIAIVFALINPLLWEVQSQVGIGQFFFDLLWGVDYYIYFPFFTWIFYPLVGVFVGNLLIRANDKRIFYGGLFWMGLITLILGLLIVWTNPTAHLGDYYRHRIGGNIWMGGFVLVWWATLYFCLNRFKVPHAFLARVFFWSKNVTALYFIHWVLIGWGVLLIEYESASFALTTLLILVFTVLSDRATYFWTKLRKKT